MRISILGYFYFWVAEPSCNFLNVNSFVCEQGSVGMSEIVYSDLFYSCSGWIFNIMIGYWSVSYTFSSPHIYQEFLKPGNFDILVLCSVNMFSEGTEICNSLIELLFLGGVSLSPPFSFWMILFVILSLLFFYIGPF